MVEPGRNRWSQSSLELLLMGRRCKHILLFISKRLFRIAVFTKVLRQAWLVFSKKKERNSSAGPLSAAASCQLRLPYTRQLHYIWRRQQRRRWQQQQLAVGRSFGVRTDFHFWAPLLTLIYHVFWYAQTRDIFTRISFLLQSAWRSYGETMGAAIAQWILLRLPSCCPGFETQAHHLHFFNLYCSNCIFVIWIRMWKERK